VEWFGKLLEERLSVLRDDLALRLRGSPSEALAWFELQAKEITVMASFGDDKGVTASRLDALRRQLAGGLEDEQAVAVPPGRAHWTIGP
jgi:hypothetical protein